MEKAIADRYGPWVIFLAPPLETLPAPFGGLSVINKSKNVQVDNRMGIFPMWPMIGIFPKWPMMRIQTFNLTD